MRAYEIGVIFRSDLPEEEHAALLELIQGWIDTNGGKVEKVDRWGRRRLAYPIDGQREGFSPARTDRLPRETPPTWHGAQTAQWAC